MIPYNQLSVADFLVDCQNKFVDDKPAFLALLESYIDFDEIVPVTFRNHFFASTASGIETFVTENTPKYADRIIRQLKAYAKAMNFDKSYDPYKAAYGSMLPHASDATNLYKELFTGNTFGSDNSGNGLHFSKAYIHLNSRSHLGNNDSCTNVFYFMCIRSDCNKSSAICFIYFQQFPSGHGFTESFAKGRRIDF